MRVFFYRFRYHDDSCSPGARLAGRPILIHSTYSNVFIGLTRAKVVTGARRRARRLRLRGAVEGRRSSRKALTAAALFLDILDWHLDCRKRVLGLYRTLQHWALSQQQEYLFPFPLFFSITATWPGYESQEHCSGRVSDINRIFRQPVPNLVVDTLATVVVVISCKNTLWKKKK